MTATLPKLPKAYAYLLDEPGPRVLREMLKLHGVVEKPGPGSNPQILAWAKELGLEKVYGNDAIAWCGLAIAFAVAEGGFDPPVNPLWARNWLEFGTPVKFGEEMLGDILVWKRNGGGHVAMYVGEDKTRFHAIGGNQSDAVNIRTKPKLRTGSGAFLGARRCPWRVVQPPNVRKIIIGAGGVASGSEA